MVTALFDIGSPLARVCGACACCAARGRDPSAEQAHEHCGHFDIGVVFGRVSACRNVKAARSQRAARARDGRSTRSRRRARSPLVATVGGQLCCARPNARIARWSLAVWSHAPTTAPMAAGCGVAVDELGRGAASCSFSVLGIASRQPAARFSVLDIETRQLAAPVLVHDTAPRQLATRFRSSASL